MMAMVLAFGGGGLQGSPPTTPAPVAAQLYVDGGAVSCASASASSGGCLTAGDQTVAGIKRFNDVVVGNGSYACNSKFGCGFQTTSGITVGAPIGPVLDGQSLRLMSTRAFGDPGAGVIVESDHFRDAGSYFAVNCGHPNNVPAFAVLNSGDVTWSPCPLADGTSNPSLSAGTLTHGNAASGAVALQSYAGLYLTTQGRNAENHAGRLAGGSRPVPDGGFWIQVETDGGAYFAYAGLHGNHTHSTSEPLYGGWLAEWRNPWPNQGATRAFIDVNGGFGQLHGLTFVNFPQCPGFTLIVNGGGQYFYGAIRGTLLYADDTEHWYLCKSTGWKQLAEAQ